MAISLVRVQPETFWRKYIFGNSISTISNFCEWTQTRIPGDMQLLIVMYVTQKRQNQIVPRRIKKGDSQGKLLEVIH